MLMTPLPDDIHLLVIGDNCPSLPELVVLLPRGQKQILQVKQEDWSSPEWQNERSPFKTWAVICFQPETPFDELLECLRVVSLSFRPNRLVVLHSPRNLDETLRLIQAGADGLIPSEASLKEIVEELHSPGAKREAYFPDPNRWLDSLLRVSQEIDLTMESGLQLKKLLRIFLTQLRANRASISLVQGDMIHLVASAGNKQEVNYDPIPKKNAGTFTQWVLQNGKSRFVQGHVPGGRPLEKTTSSAICSPIHFKNDVIGVVSFSSGENSHPLGIQDLKTVEVFASILGMAISNQTLLEQALETERLATIGSAMSSVSHCLKNLLTIFKGSASIMEMALDRQDLGQTAACFVHINNGIRRIENLVMDLLDMAKKRTPEMKKVDLKQLFNEIKEFYDIGHTHKLKHHLDIRCNLEEKFVVDENRLHRALLNLISNSHDAMITAGIIRLVVSRNKNNLIFTISDAGPGVPENKLEEILVPFFSTKGSTGTGLGLAMVSKFCSENDGELTLDHDPELEGLRITMSIPAITEETDLMD